MITIKQIALSGLIIILSLPLTFSQVAKKPSVEENLYCRALVASLDKMSKEWGQYDTSDTKTRAHTDYQHMIMEKNFTLTDDIPSQLGRYNIEFLDNQDLIARYKKLRKEFAILVAYPMINDGARLRVGFNFYWISFKKNRLMFGLSAWSHVFFRYDCETRQYVIDEVKLGGI